MNRKIYDKCVDCGKSFQIFIVNRHIIAKRKCQECKTKLIKARVAQRKKERLSA